MKPIELILHRQQATHTVLALNTRAAHWQASGLHFHHLHELFGSHYALLDEMVDQVAERSRMVDGAALLGLEKVLGLSDVVELSASDLGPESYFAQLLAGHEAAVAALIRDAEAAACLADLGTNDFFVGLLQSHEKFAWFYRSSLGRNGSENALNPEARRSRT